MSSVPSVSTIYPSAWLSSIAQFLIRRRILISGLIFAGLIVEDVVTGTQPHDLANLRDPFAVAGGLLVLTGLALRSWSAGVLHKDKELTTRGPYRLIRNPLYVGSFLMMFGFCTLIDDPENLFFILGPVLWLYIVKVRQEERLLSGRFPQQWAEYARTTPRFIPRLNLVDLRSDWRLAQWMRSREYQACGATLLALVALKIWHESL